MKVEEDKVPLDRDSVKLFAIDVMLVVALLKEREGVEARR